MRIQMNTLAAGPNGVWRPGTQHDVTANEAAELVSGGYATLVDAKDQAALDKALAAKPAPKKE